MRLLQEFVSNRSEPEESITDLIDELHSLLPLDSTNRRYFLVVEQYAVKLVCRDQHLGPERGRDELRRTREGVDHRCER